MGNAIKVIKPYRPTTYRGYDLYYMDKGRVQVIDSVELVFRNLNLALDWIDSEVNIC
jgi:hypothetical protein